MSSWGTIKTCLPPTRFSDYLVNIELLDRIIGVLWGTLVEQISQEPRSAVWEQLRDQTRKPK